MNSMYNIQPDTKRKDRSNMSIQSKIKVGRPSDEYEREADRVADAVMHMPDSQLQIQPVEEEEEEKLQMLPEQSDLLQMKQQAPDIQSLCPRCRERAKKGKTLDCPDCEKKLQMSPIIQKQGDGQKVTSPEISNQLYASKGHGVPLPSGVQQEMTHKMGTDFSGVNIHTDSKSHQLNNQLGARAFTHGSDIYFNKDEYNPSSSSGKRLLAHELTHVLQQHGSMLTHVVQRKIEVENPNTALAGAPPREHWEDIRDSIRTLSSNFDVDASGKVEPTGAPVCRTPANTTEECLCALHADGDTWKIKIDDTVWPHTEQANKRVVVQSTRSDIDLGAWGTGVPGGQRIIMDQWRVLGHELCGHAWLMVQGTHPVFSPVTSGGRLMGRPSHDATVQIENQIAQDVSGAGALQRGEFSDPHSGESFGRVTISQFSSGSNDVSSLPPSMQHRIDIVEQFMNRTSILKADIIGHADHTGSSAINRRVSKGRARDVRNELVRRGISNSRFNTIDGRGSAECPPAPANNSACRKVEVFMYVFESASERFP